VRRQHAHLYSQQRVAAIREITAVSPKYAETENDRPPEAAGRRKTFITDV
jgi:hypothetical protein